MVEYERFGRKKMEEREGGRMNEDIGWPPSWWAAVFCSPLLRKC
jgi:hypothetical protein